MIEAMQRLRAERSATTVECATGRKRQAPGTAMENAMVRRAGRVYRCCFGAARLPVPFPADGAGCFAFCACPDLVFKRDCSYISIHCSLEIAEISLPMASSGKSSGDAK